MSLQPIDYQKLFEDAPLARLVIKQEKKDHFYVLKANKMAVSYFCMMDEQDCHSIDGMYLRDFLDTANTTHILQVLTICYESKVSVSVQVIPKMVTHKKIQNFLMTPILSDDGEVMYVDMVARAPVNEQAMMERERDDAISMFTTVFDVSDVGITVTDHHGRFVRLNDAFLEQTGWVPMDLIGQELSVIIPPDEREVAWERHRDALLNKRKNFGEIRILKKDGSIMNVMVTSVMMELSNGRTFRITTVVDVTELKQIEYDLRQAKEQADEANMAKSAFLANMSHELRTPLNAIIGFSEMMIAGTLGPVENPTYIEYLGDIKFSAQHLLHIINDVLDMSKIDAGKMPLNEEDIQIESLLDSTCRLMTARAKDKSIQIDIDKPDAANILRADERLLRQVFLNLLSNAIKFSHQGGVVKIKSFINGQGALQIDVIDKGIGIPAEHIKDVIEPFGQVSDPRVNKGQGTGLGLPIAKAMMEMHGGSLTIESEKDKGTIVTCLFPKERIVISQ